MSIQEDDMHSNAAYRLLQFAFGLALLFGSVPETVIGVTLLDSLLEPPPLLGEQSQRRSQEQEAVKEKRRKRGGWHGMIIHKQASGNTFEIRIRDIPNKSPSVLL